MMWVIESPPNHPTTRNTLFLFFILVFILYLVSVHEGINLEAFLLVCYCLSFVSKSSRTILSWTSILFCPGRRPNPSLKVAVMNEVTLVWEICEIISIEAVAPRDNQVITFLF